MIERRLSRALVGACFVAALLSLESCAPKPQKNDALRLGMVTDVGGLGDRSFNDSAYAGLKRAQANLGATIQVLQSRSAADYQPNLTVLANQGFDEIYAIGFLMNKDVAEVATRFPKRHFAIVDAVVDRPNVASVTFKEEDGSFLAGALAAAVSKSKTIAFLGGVDLPLLRKFEAGFAAGARQIDPAVKVLVKYVGSFEDVAAGKELAGVLFAEHADIIFVAAGKSGLGAIDQVKNRKHSYVIGVDSNQDALAPGKILTSMVKRVDVGVYRIAAGAQAHKPLAGHLVLGLKDDGVGLTDFKYTKDAIGASTIARLAALRAAIVNGKVTPPATREELATFKPVKLWRTP